VKKVYVLNSVTDGFVDRGFNVHFFEKDWAERSIRCGDAHFSIFVSDTRTAVNHRNREPNEHELEIAHRAIAFNALNGSCEGFPEVEFDD
jgi:hypothetical protein